MSGASIHLIACGWRQKSRRANIPLSETGVLSAAGYPAAASARFARRLGPLAQRRPFVASWEELGGSAAR